MNEIFIEYADNPAAGPQTGVSWASPQNGPTIQRVLRRLLVPESATDANKTHGYKLATIKNLKIVNVTIQKFFWQKRI